MSEYFFTDELNTGTTDNDGTGEPLRGAMRKLITNDNYLKEQIDAEKTKLTELDEKVTDYGSNQIVKHNLGGSQALINNPLEGRGYADEVLFDLTKFIESTSILNISDQGFDVNIREALENTDYHVVDDAVDFAGSRVLRTNKFLEFVSDYIPVKSGERIYGEVFGRHVSGATGNKLYFGVQQYDSEKNPISSNSGTAYPFATNIDFTASSWSKHSGYYTVPETHTPYSSSDGGSVCFIKVVAFLNHADSDGGVRDFAGFTVKRITKSHDLDIDGDVNVSGAVTVTGDVTCNDVVETSDKKYKKNIEEIDGEWALKVFKALKFSAYNFLLTDKKAFGLIAQEVEELVPEAVFTNEAGDKAINYRYINTIVNAALQHFIKRSI